MSINRKQQIHTSFRILQTVMILGWLILMGRLFQLQIVDYDKYAPMSRQNFIRQEHVAPSRGLIYDRHGTIMVENEPIYSISITPASFDMSRTGLLAELLGIEEELLLDRIGEAQSYSWHRSSRLFTEVSFDVFSNIQENLWRLPGIHHQIESKRHYPLQMRAAHTFGYLREATLEEYRQSEHIRLGDRIGKSGIEMIYEEYLRGEPGTGYTRVNALGQSLGQLVDHDLSVPPVQGNDLITSLDAELQMLAEEIMEGKKGSLVAMDPHTGEILTIVSSPQYDVSRLAGRLDLNYWLDINRNPNTPLFNRAISSQQPPGSTFKPFMGLIGLHLGLITPETEIYNPGAYYRGRAYRDLADPGNYDLERAIRQSSNTFFFHMMDRIASRGMLNQWSRLARDFGMGERNYIDLPFETSGIMPDSTYMDRTFGERQWGVGDLMSLGVGQGMVSVSPLQMAVSTSSIANGGYRIQPHIVRSIRETDSSVSFTEPGRKKIEWIDPEHLETVQRGMRGVVTDGSGRWYSNLPDVAVAGKTGTAQNPHGENHGWYIAYAPYENPQIAVAVLIENGGFGSISAAPVASLVIEQYLNGEIGRQHVLDYVLDFTNLDEEETVEETAPLDLQTAPAQVVPETEQTPQPASPDDLVPDSEELNETDPTENF